MPFLHDKHRIWHYVIRLHFVFNYLFFDFDFPIQFAGLPLPVADSVVFFRIAATLSSQPGTVREGPGNFFQLSFEVFFLRLKDFSDLCRHSL